jgi:hypothetical protein
MKQALRSSQRIFIGLTCPEISQKDKEKNLHAHSTAMVGIVSFSD